jgi:hypothetical protein
MNGLDFVQKFRNILPSVVTWIESTIKENQDQAVSVSSLNYPRLVKALPPDLLSRARVVVVKGQVPFPPLSRMGLPGITYKDTFFLNHLRQQQESLYFHELVHVIQWERLGVNNFLLTYGAGLMRFGYRDSPLEEMAFSLQTEFERGILPPDVVKVIKQRTDTIWTVLAPMFSKT